MTGYFVLGEFWVVIVPATSRHTNLLLPLLTSVSGGVHSVSLRENRYNYHNDVSRLAEDLRIITNNRTMTTKFMIFVTFRGYFDSIHVIF